MSKVLVIDDENTILENIKFVLELESFDVITSSCSLTGLEIFKDEFDSIDVVITDMKMPKLSGMDVLKEIKYYLPQMSVVVLTGHGDLENAILAMKEGAFEYLSKPIKADKLAIVVNKAITQKKMLLENHKMHQEILHHRNHLQSLNNSAQKILLNMLPKSVPSIRGFNFCVKYESCDTVGGDMYGISDIGTYVYLYIFDVSSHGILAAVVATILNSFLQNMEYNYKQGINKRRFPEIVADLNNLLLSTTAQNVFATLFLGFIDKEKNIFYYVSAGHITQYLLNSDGIKELPSTGVILGVFEDTVYTCNVIPLNPGDKIILFTDGILEVSNDDKILGSENIEKLLLNNKEKPLCEIVDFLLKAAKEYADDTLADDVTILGVELK